MKRIFTVLIAAAMLLALFAVPAAASGNARFTLTGPASARPGDTITVSLNVSGQYGAHALDMMIFFDNTSFRFKNCVNGSALDGLTGAWPLSGLHKDGNAVSFGVLMLTDPLTVQGELLKITFEVLSSASSSPVFTIGVNKFSNIPVNGSETPIPYSASDLTISINGGSGSGTTPAPAVTPKPVLTPIPKTPAPTAKPKTAAPIGTPKPGATPGPGTGKETDGPGGGIIGTPAPVTPKPGEKTAEPGQAVITPLPTRLPAGVTEAPADATNVPENTSGADSKTTRSPFELNTDSPFDTGSVLPTNEAGEQNPGGQGNEPASRNNDGTLKTVLIIAACAIAAGLAALCTVLGIRAKKKNKAE